jgi:trehalose 6-phosphate synthase/phosphatase
MSDGAHIDNWKTSVKEILRYYLERTPGAEVEERHCSLLFHYDGAEDQEAAVRLAADCASHVNDACESQRVHAIVLDGTIAVEPLDWTKSTAANKVFDKLTSQASSSEGGNEKPVDFLMVVGDGREDEKVFKWANKLDKRRTVENVVTVSLGNRSTEAASTLTQGVSGEYPHPPTD